MLRITQQASLFYNNTNGRTRTVTAFATATSRLRVYQFHHVGLHGDSDHFFVTGANINPALLSLFDTGAFAGCAVNAAGNTIASDLCALCAAK